MNCAIKHRFCMLNAISAKESNAEQNVLHAGKIRESMLMDQTSSASSLLSKNSDKFNSFPHTSPDLKLET